MEFTLLTIFLITVSAYITYLDAVCEEEKSLDWSYHTELNNGPQHWGEKYPQCSGKQQSPINIVTAKVVNDSTLKPLELINYEYPLTYYKASNTGYTINITSMEEPKKLVQRMVIVNGETYFLSYIQFHWGDADSNGSEHTVDNKTYAFEMQLVHTNQEGKIAIVAVLFEPSTYDNAGISGLLKILGSVAYKGNSLQNFADGYAIELSQLVTNGCSFYRYNGSLTIPKCDEGIIWSICKIPRTIGSNQLNQFRKLHDVMDDPGKNLTECLLTSNFRPIQPLNGRIVTSST